MTIAVEFNLEGLVNHKGSLVGSKVVPNDQGSGYDMQFIHRSLDIRQPMTVLEDFNHGDHRKLTVEDHRGTQDTVVAERLILADL